MKPEELFKGLADPTRLRIALLLLDRELCVCDLMVVLQLPQSTASRHMSRMKSAGLVADRRKGKWVHYRFVETPSVNELRAYMKRNLATLEPYRSDRVTLAQLVRSGKCASVAPEDPRHARAKKPSIRKVTRVLR
jgi:ArsR family transcriptional regulator